MNLGSFLAGAAAAATVVTAFIAVILYLRGRSRIAVQAVRHQYAVPPPVGSLLRELDELRPNLPDKPSSESLEAGLRARLQNLTELASDPMVSAFGRSWAPDTLWSIQVRNNGGERAERLELQIPHAEVSILTHSDGSEDVIAGGTIRIPELRPGERTTILSWSNSSPSDEPTFLQTRGRAKLDVLRLGPELVAVYRTWRVVSSLAGVLYLLFLVGALFWLLAVVFERPANIRMEPTRDWIQPRAAHSERYAAAMSPPVEARW